jgi:AbrB family looped-hinge helix DNA binding protein
MGVTAKITRKGQVTIPREIRKTLESDVVEFSVIKGEIVLRPVKSVAGSLSAYKKRGPKGFQKQRETAWTAIVQEEYGKKVD